MSKSKVSKQIAQKKETVPHGAGSSALASKLLKVISPEPLSDDIFLQSNTKTDIEDARNSRSFDANLRESSSSEDEEPAKIEKTKKPYIMTEARKAAFEKARIARADNIARRKQVKEKEVNELTKFKEEKIKKKTMKEKQKEEQIAKLEESSSSEDEPIIVKKKKTKKKKVIYISEDDDDNKGNIIIVNKMAETKPSLPLKAQRKTPLFL